MLDAAGSDGGAFRVTFDRGRSRHKQKHREFVEPDRRERHPPPKPMHDHAVSFPLVVALAGAGLVAQEPVLESPDGTFRLVDVSLDLLTSAGTSTARNAELAELKGGAHDPRRRGFTLQQAELSLAGEIGEDISGRAALIVSIDPEEGETVTELEEAYLTYRLPEGFGVDAGLFFSNVGRLNPRHPHERDWLDQPVIHTRLFGGDGMRAPGVRLLWNQPGDGPLHGTFSLQNANGETMTSFLANDEVYDERPIGGRMFDSQTDVRGGDDIVYTARAAVTLPAGADATLQIGGSAAFGPNATGAAGDTLLYGVDFAWRQSCDHEGHDGHGHAALAVEGEVLARAFDAAPQVDASVPATPVTLPGETLDDYGAWLQVLGEVAPRWRVGLRGEWAAGSGQSYDMATQSFGRRSDPFRTDRVRVSPLVMFEPSAGTRIRLQYDWDDSDHLGGDEHSIWIGFELQLGPHPAHEH